MSRQRSVQQEEGQREHSGSAQHPDRRGSVGC